MRAWSRWPLPALLALLAGCIDTAPGIEWRLRADPEVRVDARADEFTVEVLFEVHVGTYALAGRGAQVERVEVLLRGEPVGWGAPREYEGPSGAVEPGETVPGRVLAAGRPSGFPRLIEVCDAPADDVGVALLWSAEVDDTGGGGGGGPLRREMGRLEGAAGVVGCTR